MQFKIYEKNGATSVTFNATSLVIAGWAGRNLDDIEHHILELEAIGVKRPSKVPLFYRVATNQLTQSENTEVLGTNTSGEVEPFAFFAQGQLYIGLASDHTDRTLEIQSVALSKQICAKPISTDAWLYSEIEDHWDDIIFKSWIIDENHQEHLYQQGNASSLINPQDLLKEYLGSEDFKDGLCMTCGTFPVIGSIRPAKSMRIEMRDNVLGRHITHQYYVNVLEEIS